MKRPIRHKKNKKTNEEEKLKTTKKEQRENDTMRRSVKSVMELRGGNKEKRMEGNEGAGRSKQENWTAGKAKRIKKEGKRRKKSNQCSGKRIKLLT